MSNEIEMTYSTAFPQLAALLATVKRPGDYYATGSVETIMPGITIEGVGPLSFPVPSSQAHEIISIAAERAPYGKGAETLVDESVRKVWQISPDKISLTGKGWAKTLEEIVSKTAECLGCLDAKVEAEFYKLLVYDKGGFFVAHRDSEKTGGMFGTLVVSLPSDHEGGTLTVRHAGRETSLDLCPSEPGEIRYAAFYADCEHEVGPITKGYRVCLIYNLVQKASKGASITTPDHRTMIQSAAELLRHWNGSEDAPPHKLVYLLEHHYTQAGLSFSALKNGDAALATVLSCAAQEADCDIHLGIVHIQESGSAEYTGYYGRGHYHDEDDDDDDSEYEVGEVFDRNEYISDWRDVYDLPVDLGQIPLNENELLPAEALDGEKPDEVHFSEATGNAGAEFERTYLRAALILWPHVRFNEVAFTGGLESALRRFGVVATKFAVAKAEDQSSILASLHQILDFISNGVSAAYDKSSPVNLLLQHLATTHSRDLMQQAFDELVCPYYDGKQNERLLECAKAIPPAEILPLLIKLIDLNTQVQPARCIKLWHDLARQHHLGDDELTKLAKVLISRLNVARQPELHSDSYYRTDEGTYTKPDLDAIDEKMRAKAEAEGSHLNARLLADFLTSVHHLNTPELLAETIKIMVANPTVFAPDRLITRCLEMLLAEPQWQGEPLLRSLWQLSATQLLERSSLPPAPPANWAQSNAISENCAESRQLSAFAKDPLATEHRFKMRQDLRYKVLQLIRDCDFDMRAITDRKGSPQTLVVTKTRSAHDVAIRHYQADLARMKRLIGLAKSNALLDKQGLSPRLQAAVNGY